MSVFVGLDCGGSSSRVLAVDDQGDVLFQGHSGAANLVSTPESRLRRNLQHATRDCPPARFVCGCFAGLVSEDVRIRGELLLRDLFPDAVVRAEPDYTAAFYACPSGTNICVISGTGSLVCSRHEGRMVKGGGRGYLLGDQGSGFHYGREALVAFLDDPHGTSDGLRAAVVDAFGSDQESVIVPTVYRSNPATLLAKLAKAVGSDAKNGLAYATKIVDRNSLALAEVVGQHIQRYHADRKTINLCLAGGLWKSSPVFRDVFAEKIALVVPDTEFVVARILRPPLVGAVELAKEMSNGN